MFEKIKKYYELGIYKDKHIQKLLDKNVITKEEYNLIKNS